MHSVLLIGLVAWSSTIAQDAPATAERDVAPAVVSAGDLADHADRYFHRQVLVRADVEDIYAPAVFTLDEDKVWSTGDDVLVVADGLQRPVEPGSDLTVRGTVVPYPRGLVRQRLAGHAPDVTADLLSALGGRPVILATSVRNQYGDELLAPSEDER